VPARTLTALEFVHSGRHRAKFVQLWQQGEARVLLNAAPRAVAMPGTTAITAFAVESDDPAASARRAEHLRASAWPWPPPATTWPTP
jgi:4-hydroxyphenylpyruvate dioxygenase-like putative hemolysin